MDDNKPDTASSPSDQNNTERGKTKLLGIERYKGYNLYRFSDGSEIKVKMAERKKKKW